MGRTRRIKSPSARLSGLIVAVCLLICTGTAPCHAQPGEPQRVGAPEKLEKADLLGLLDCATRADQLLAIKADAYGRDGFRVRYIYPVLPGREANMLNALAPENWVVLVLYHTDGRSGALFEVGFEERLSVRTYTLIDGANLQRESGRWVIKNILNGVGSTWPEVARHVEKVSIAPIVEIPRGILKRTNVTCQFPPSGLTFSAASSDGDKSNWAFKDGVSSGVPFQSQSGPFKNTDLKSIPSAKLYLNFYGPS